MKKEKYETIYNTLQNHVNNCKKYLDHILTKNDLLNVSISEYKELISFAKQEQSDMDYICTIELYHIIGMGNLTVVQKQKLLTLFNEYLTYRADIKCIAINASLENIPNLPTLSKFKLSKLGNFYLQSQGRKGLVGDIIEDFENETSKEKAEGNKERLPSVVVEGNRVTLDVSDVDDFLPNVVNSDAKKENFLKACKDNLNFCDVIWEYTDPEETKIKGIFVTSHKKNSITQKIKNIKKG